MKVFLSLVKSLMGDEEEILSSQKEVETERTVNNNLYQEELMIREDTFVR